MTDAPTHHAIRGVVSRVVIRSTNDNGENQTATVTMFKDVDRSDVEVLQPYGFGSRPKAKAGVGIVLAVGGDQGDLVLLPVGSPSTRMGKLEEGETAIYVENGSRVHIKADGTINVFSSKKVHAKVKNTEFELDNEIARGRVGSNGPRFVARPGYAKLRSGAHWLVVDEGGIKCSVIPVVGPDPEPGV